MGRLIISALVLAAFTAACAPLPPPPAEPVFACTATDGDTIRCGDERIRLLGIDAPELAGHCREGRACVAGSGPASREALASAIAGRALAVRRTGVDRYGRTLGVVEACAASSSRQEVGEQECVSTSCSQLEQGFAVYVRRWDDRRLVARACPELAG